MKKEEPFLSLKDAYERTGPDSNGVPLWSIREAIRREEIPHRRRSLAKKARIQVQVSALKGYLQQLQHGLAPAHK